MLKPEWVTDGVYRILNSGVLFRAGGVLEVTELGEILRDPARFPPAQHRFIIEMMRKFELCFDFLDSAGHKLLVPELLSPNEPDLNWPPPRDALNFQYHYDVLPGGLISRFIVRMHHDLTDKPTYWRSGVVLDIDGNKAFVRAHTEDRRIYVSVVGPEKTRRHAISVIRDRFKEIHATIPKIQAVQKVPLPDDPETLVDYDELLALERDGHTSLPRRLSDGTTRTVDVRQLLDGISQRETRAQEQRLSEAHQIDLKTEDARALEIIRAAQEEALSEPAPQSKSRSDAMQHKEAQHHHQPTWERVAITAIGVAFVATLLSIALFVPNPTEFQVLIFRVVLALAAGAFGALIPGFIEVSFRNWLRAGGAMALFVIVYMINPPALIAESAIPPQLPTLERGN